jgi:prepilin-type N-terminal cleavage/methylation domain-containing protein
MPIKASFDVRRVNRVRAEFTLVEIMIVVAVIGLLAAMGIPNFVRARKRSLATTTLADVRLIDAAKSQFAMESRKPGTFVPMVADNRPYLQVGSRLYNNIQLSNFRDIFGNPIQMNDLNAAPTIAEATRDYFADVIPNNQEFWGSYCN